jgi:hypothetical protein
MERQILVDPTLLVSPQLRVIAGQNVTLYGLGYPTMTGLAGVDLDGKLISLVETTDANPIKAVVTIPANITPGMHTLTLLCGGSSAKLQMPVCVPSVPESCNEIIGLTTANDDLPEDIVIGFSPYVMVEDATFKVIGEGFWHRAVSLYMGPLGVSGASDLSLLGSTTADLTGHFLSPQFNVPPGSGEKALAYNVTAEQIGFCIRSGIHCIPNVVSITIDLAITNPP